MADLLLKVRKEDYEAALNKANAAIDELDAILSEYDTLLNSLDSDVIEQADDNFEATERAVKENIRATKANKRTGENVREALQEQVRVYDEASAQFKNTLNAAVDAAASTIDAAISASSLLDG